MSKPLEHYVDTNIPVIKDIEREYGSNLEGMSEQCKLCLTKDLAVHLLLSSLEPPLESEELKINKFFGRIKQEISEHNDAINLIKAIANNL